MQGGSKQDDSSVGKTAPDRPAATSGHAHTVGHESAAPRASRRRGRRRPRHDRSKAPPPRARSNAPAQAWRTIEEATDPALLVEMGEDARKRRWIGVAVRCFERALEIDPSNLGALSGLGYTHLEIGDYARAFEFLEKGLEQADGDGKLIYGAAIALLTLRRHDAALSYALRLIERQDRESRSNGHYIAGNVAYARGEFAVAAEHLATALELGNNRRKSSRRAQETRLQLADTYLELDRPEEALKLFRRVLHSKWSRGIEDRAGRLCLELGRIAEAKRSFERILGKDPDDVRALTGLGRAHLHQHEYADAIRMFGKALQRDSTNLHALDGMAEAYKGEGNLDKAARYIEQVKGIYRLPEVQIQRRLDALAQERERRNAELLRMRNIASLNVMATGIAHELRQPLSVIRLAASNARCDLEAGDINMVAQDLEDIDHHVEKIDRVIHLLRDVSAGSNGNVEPLLLHEVVDRALELFHRQLDNRRIEVRGHDLDFQVTSDESALLQILINLIGNARDAMAHSESKVLEIWAVQAPNRIILYVRDTGAGMSNEVRRQAFDPFFSTKKNEGVGVGLYIAYNLARKMSGTLSIKMTSPGRGTTMELSLPRAAAGGQ